MILTMVDADHRLRVYKYNGKGLEELAALKAASDDPLELAQMAATLALMAGETNGSAPPKTVKAKAKVVEPEPTPALEPVRLGNKRWVRSFNPDYTPDLGSDVGKMLILLEQGGSYTSHEVARFLNKKRDGVGATLSQLNRLGALDAEDVHSEESGRKVKHYSITQHGRDSLARSRGELV